MNTLPPEDEGTTEGTLLALQRILDCIPDEKTNIETPRAETTARMFHEAYERLAPLFGYETRKDTKAFDPNTQNGKLMIAVCNEIVTKIQSETVANVADMIDGDKLTATVLRQLSKKITERTVIL